MSTQNDVLIDAGVDYITAIHVGPRSESLLCDFGKLLVSEERSKGEKWRSFRASGYHGEQCGSASFGVRFDSQMLRLSSKVAQEHWEQAFNLATNITRLDLQVTVVPFDGPTRRLLKHHKQLRRRKRERGRPPKYKFWYGPDGPEAAVLGVRVSDWFARIYDKGLESKLPEYVGSLRYELELKRLVAKNTAALLERDVSVPVECARIISKFVTNRALRVPEWFSSTFEPGPTFTARDSRGSLLVSGQDCSALPRDGFEYIGQGAARRKLRWLHNAVRPSVQQFMAQGNTEAVLSALGLSVDNGALCSSEAARWSNFQKWR